MIEKIDIIGEQIFTYDENFNAIKTLPLTIDYDVFIKEFSNTQNLLTVNISKPIKRIMNYYDNGEFIESDYDAMTKSQKTKTDNFIIQINDAINAFNSL
jgi:hypothetical protein